MYLNNRERLNFTIVLTLIGMKIVLILTDIYTKYETHIRNDRVCAF
jgi:hypothetical protein